MNEEIRDEKKQMNKKEDKKALKVFIPLVIAGFFVGLFMGFCSSVMEATLADVIAGGIGTVLTYITPYANVVLSMVLVVVGVLLYSKAKKEMKEWDGENEEVYESIDKKLSFLIVFSNVVYIIAMFIMAAGFEYCIQDGTAIQLILYFTGFIAALVINIVLQQVVVNATKELNPEKSGSVFAADFQKKWTDSCDEAEMQLVYKATFGAYKVGNGLYFGLWLFCILGNQVWHFGLMPVAIVTVIWLTQFIAYQSYLVYYSKHPEKH